MRLNFNVNRIVWGVLWLSLPIVVAGCGSSYNTTDTYQIQMAVYTPLCLEVTGASVSEGQTVETYPCISGERRQVWSFRPVGETTDYQIVNSNSLQCMTVSYGSTSPSTLVVQAPCYTPIPSSQVWSYVPSTTIKAGYNLISAAGGQCLDIPEGATVGEANMQVYPCNAMVDPAQVFVLHGVPHGDTP